MRTVEWLDGVVRMIDQRAIPWKLDIVTLSTYQEVAEAISNMTVRGAPAIGASAGFGLALAAYQSTAQDIKTFLSDLTEAGNHLKAARPTAVNLAWAVDKLLELARHNDSQDIDELQLLILSEAQKIATDDVDINRKMGYNGAELIQPNARIMHHCNTGALATVDFGTALGVVRAAHEQGKNPFVYLDETRPRLQGARLSAWELDRLGVDYAIIADTASGYFMRQGNVDIILVGADRVAANGDFANKIGTYQLGVLAKENNIPFYTVAPTSTIDLNIATGDDIPIEERDISEVLTPYANALTVPEFKALNPAFDVTPHRYLSGIITENGIVRPPFKENLARVVAGEQV